MKRNADKIFLTSVLVVIEIVLLIEYFITKKLYYFYFIGLLLVPLIVLIIHFINQYKIIKKEETILIGENIKLSLTNLQFQKDIAVQNNYVLGEYIFDNKTYKFKQKIEYNLNDLLYKFKLHELPILVSLNNPNNSILDEAYIASLMKERNKSGEEILTKDYSSKEEIPLKRKEHILSKTLILYTLMFIAINIIVAVMTKKTDDLLTSVYIYVVFFFMILLLYFIRNLNNFIDKNIKINDLSKNKIKIVGYIEKFYYESDNNYAYYRDYINLHVPNPYYVLKVSYTYNKKIYVINSSNIYFKLNQVSNFIPVFIDPNNPSKAYVDIDYLK